MINEILKNCHIEKGVLYGEFIINDKEENVIFINSQSVPKCHCSCDIAKNCEENKDECYQCLYNDNIIYFYDKNFQVIDKFIVK